MALFCLNIFRNLHMFRKKLQILKDFYQVASFYLLYSFPSFVFQLITLQNSKCLICSQVFLPLLTCCFYKKYLNMVSFYSLPAPSPPPSSFLPSFLTPSSSLSLSLFSFMFVNLRAGKREKCYNWKDMWLLPTKIIGSKSDMSFLYQGREKMWPFGVLSYIIAKKVADSSWKNYKLVGCSLSLDPYLTLKQILQPFPDKLIIWMKNQFLYVLSYWDLGNDVVPHHNLDYHKISFSII